MTLAEDQEAGAAQQHARPGRTIPRQASRYLALNRLSGMYALGVIILIFALWTPQTFLTLSTVRSIAMAWVLTLPAAITLAGCIYFVLRRLV